MKKEDKYLGTKLWLRLQGVRNPPRLWMQSFHRKMTLRASIVMVSVTIVLIVWVLFLYHLP